MQFRESRDLSAKTEVKILFVSPEVSPLVRTGGLGDVVGSLPIALKNLGLDIRIVCPLHRSCKTLPFNYFDKTFEIGGKKQERKAKLAETRLGESDVPVYFVENEFLYDRPGIYSDDRGDYKDNPQRVFGLCKSAMQIEAITGWRPDVFHAHDWMAAPICAFLNNSKTKGANEGKQASVLTIHNLEHQGNGSYEDFTDSGLPLDYWSSSFDRFGSMNLLKSGIQHADKITTVSPTYAQEIRNAEFGHGLEESLKYRGADIIGILNGIDQESWNPLFDQSLASSIDPKNPSEGKTKCKTALLKEMNLPQGNDAPLFGVVSRLYRQKGLDLLLENLPFLLNQSNAQFVILGSGSKTEEAAFLKIGNEFPNRLAAYIGFDDGLARRIFAGTDFFLMPSRFEPCGLAQQYAMRYGSIPIGRKTGGLADTIQPIEESQKTGNGFLFDKAEPEPLLKVINKAIELFEDRPCYDQIQKNALNLACSWEFAAEDYQKVYSWALADS